MNLDPIVYENLEPLRIPVTIGKTQYELRECDESGAMAVKNAALSGVELVTEEGNGQRVMRKLNNVGAVNAVIVSQCLYERHISAKDEETWRKVGQLRVQALPPKLVRELAKRAKEISDLDEDDSLESLKKQRDALMVRIAKMETDLPKNEPSATETTSA